MPLFTEIQENDFNGKSQDVIEDKNTSLTEERLSLITVQTIKEDNSRSLNTKSENVDNKD